jgi:hypothetical protein
MTKRVHIHRGEYETVRGSNVDSTFWFSDDITKWYGQSAHKVKTREANRLTYGKKKARNRRAKENLKAIVR